MFRPPPKTSFHSVSDQPVTLAEILSALSFALDVTEGARPGHAVRTCILGMRIGKEIGLSEPLLAELYHALLLKDIGCSSNSARMADAFAADDQVVKQNYKLIDREKLGKPNREALRFVWNNIAPQTSVLNRAIQMYRMVRMPGNLTAEVIETRCERGAVILHKLGMGIETCAAVYSLDEHWNGHGLPDHLMKKDIPVLGRICAIAQHLDLFCSEFSSTKALETLAERAGTWFDPDLVQAASSLSQQGLLWGECLPGSDSDALRSAVLALDPGSSNSLAANDIDLICSAFADVIDAKSPFAYRHSAATTEVAVLMGQALGLSPERTDVVRRAALLHDIGMLSVPNTLLDRRGRLSAHDWKVVHQHPLLSANILSRIRAFDEVALLSEQHHEKLDGSGYPYGLEGKQLSLESRILAVADMFAGMMGSRSYRKDLNPVEMQRQLEKEMSKRLDAKCIEAVFSILDQLAELPLSDVPGTSYPVHTDSPTAPEPPPFHFDKARR